MSMYNVTVNRIADALKQSNYTVVLTGAGMSTESGLKDFRSTGGMWNDHNIYEIARPEGMVKNPILFNDFYKWRIREVMKHKPNAGHHAIAEMVSEGRIQSIITQNVDGYHRELSSNLDKIIELHGDIRFVDCIACEFTAPSKSFLKSTMCPMCGNMMRPSIVMFGESLDELAVGNAFKEASKSALTIVIGSSLAVSPANYIPAITKAEGGKIVLINREPVDSLEWDISITGHNAGDVLTDLYNAL
jgi:NAD-dependent deacetylase